MLSPNPISLLCAIILSLPLALLFTISDHSSSSSTTTTTTTVAATVDLHKNTNTIPTISTANNINAQSQPRQEQQPSYFHLEKTRNTTTQTRTNRATKPLRAPLEPDDDRLLRVASGVSAKPSSPPKVAFMFLTTTPLPFAPLWDRFFLHAPPHLFTVYVHADPTYNYTPSFGGVFSGRVIPFSKPTRRNTPSLALAARRLLAHALVDDPANSMFVLLSPACIPLRSFDFIYNFLVRSGRSFVEVLKNEKTARGRYEARGEHAMLPEVKFDRFRVGSQFWVLTRAHARVMARDRALWTKFGLPCLPERADACYPEENYFPTVVSMADTRGAVVPATLTHVDWQGRWDGHPRAYNASEIGAELIGRLRRLRPRYGSEVVERWDPFLFARKFEPECLQALMNIADEVIFGERVCD